MMGGACNTHWRDKMHKTLRSENLKERGHLEYKEANGIMTSKYDCKKRLGGCRVDTPSSER
jgi:hypothetical protein